MNFESLHKILEEIETESPQADHNLESHHNLESPQTSQASNQTNIKKPFAFRPPSLINYNNTMANFKPEYLQCIPEFNGDAIELNRFLNVSESIINSFYDATNPASFHNTYLLNSIISKLKGNARALINIQGADNWQQLKELLYRNFSDQRDEACLNRDLIMLKQFHNETPQKYYDRILHILNLLCSYVDIHETTAEGKVLKRKLYQNLALKTFLSGLREPLGNTIRCMKPIDLPQALQYVIEEENIHYFQQFKMNSKPEAFNKPNPIIQNSSNPFLQNQRTNNNPFQQTKPFFNSNNFRPQQNTPNYNFQQSKPSSSQFKPNLFIKPNPQFPHFSPFGKPPSNTFRQNNNNFRQPPPTPMSTSTNYKKPNYSSNHNNYKKLFNIETTGEQNPEYPEVQNYQEYTEEEYQYLEQADDQNFRNVACTDKKK